MTKRRGTWPQDFAIQDLRHSSPARGFFPLLLSTLLLFPNYLHQITVRKTQSSLAWELCSLVPPPLPPRHIFVAGRLMLHHTRAPRYHVKTHASSHLSQRLSDLTPPFSSSLSSTNRFSSLPPSSSILHPPPQKLMRLFCSARKAQHLIVPLLQKPWNVEKSFCWPEKFLGFV